MSLKCILKFTLTEAQRCGRGGRGGRGGVGAAALVSVLQVKYYKNKASFFISFIHFKIKFSFFFHFHFKLLRRVAL